MKEKWTSLAGIQPTGAVHSARTLATVVLIVILMAPLSSAAQQFSRRPSAAEIVQRLKYPAGPPPALSRGLTPSSSSAKDRGVGVLNPPPSIELDVNFEFNAARLTPDARGVLDNLGEALNDPLLQGGHFRIAGHTDGKGSEAYNQQLSLQRARSVADYLRRRHGIEAKRLDIQGYGKQRLLHPDDPLNAQNRRVEVSNLGDGG